MMMHNACWLGRLANLLLIVLAVCLLRAPICSTQRSAIQVTRTREGDIVNILQQETYYIFEGDGIAFSCFCDNNGATLNTRIVSLRWKHAGQVVAERESCMTLIHNLVNATSANNGMHVCEVTFANGTVSSNSAGTLQVVDPTRIQAPPYQHGLINTTTVLSCSTTFQELDALGISITWQHHGQAHNGQIDSVRLDNEGMYMCSIYLGLYNLRMIKKINFSVIVPPTIISKPMPYTHLLGNQLVTFPVTFRSRFRQDTVIVWYKNDNSAVPSNLVRTAYEEEPDPTARTELYFDLLRRRDAGTYRVVILNTFEDLPGELRQVEASFTVDVTVEPVAPSNIQFLDISSDEATVTWSLTNQNEDDLPDNITVMFSYSNGTLARQYVVDGESTQLVVELLPGMEYNVIMRATNIDGEADSEVVTFQSVSGAPSLPNVAVTRQSATVLELTVSLAYTGGGNITHFSLSFRRIGTEEWIPVGRVEAVPTGMLEWGATVIRDEFSQPGIELQVFAINSRGYSSPPFSQPEPIELPGSPRQPFHISSSHDSILIQVQLSLVGAPPILSLDVDFLSHPDLNKTVEGPFQLGELVQFTIGGLEDDTLYRFAVVAVNHGGRGTPSPSIAVRTVKLPPVPLYGIVLISVGAAIVIIIIIVILALVGKHVYNIQKAKREYKFPSGTSSDAVKSLESGHELVSGTKRPLPIAPLPSCSSPSMFSERPPSQSTYSRQGSSSTYPLSPQRTISTSDGGGSPTGEFHFERRDSSETSTNNDSESETNFPRYTYKVSPSPPNLSTPQLRAHSLHSMQSYHSTATRLDSTTSTSTRESLILSPTEFNATNV